MACCTCILIDVACFWLHTGAVAKSAHIDEARAVLEQWQLAMIDDYIGQACYDELCQRQSTDTLTPLDNELIQWLSRAAAKYWLIDKTTNSDSVNSSGIVLTNYGQYSNIAPDQMYAKRQEFRVDYDYVLDRLYVFLYDNQEAYPCLPANCLHGHFQPCGCGCGRPQGRCCKSGIRKRYDYGMGGYVNSL
jgi:hypothetical protein